MACVHTRFNLAKTEGKALARRRAGNGFWRTKQFSFRDLVIRGQHLSNVFKHLPTGEAVPLLL